MGSVLMLSGPIGAGKTTVAAEMVALARGQLVYIEGDRFWPFIAKSIATRREHFPVLMRSMTAAAVPFARSGFDVLLDFSFHPQFMPTALKIVKELPLDLAVLLPPIEVCAERAAVRKEGRIAKYAAYRDFYNMFADTGERYIIPVEKLQADEVAADIWKRANAGELRVTAA